MKNLKAFTATIVTMFLCYIVSAQCPQGNITLTTQQEVDDFATTYPGCTELTGNITIGYSYSNSSTGFSSINDLSPLNNINTIHGNMTVTNNSILSDLAGLSGLETIGGDLSIFNNTGLVSLNGLDNLETIEGGLKLGHRYVHTIFGGVYTYAMHRIFMHYEGNDVLADISALSNIDTLEHLMVIGNPGLTNLSGLDNLTTINNDFFFIENHNVVDFSGLENLTHIGGDLTVGRIQLESVFGGYPPDLYKYYNEGNDGLTTFSGLENLAFVGGDFIIGDNTAMINIDALNQLQFIGGNFNFYSNNQMTNLSGLSGLTSIGGNLEFAYEHDQNDWNNNTPIGNHALTDLTGLENLNSINGEIYIVNNTALTSLSALNNLDHTGITNLTLTSNQNLSVCNATAICDYLENGGQSYILNNSTGCYNYIEVENTCNGIPVTCPQLNIVLNTQQEVNEFPVNYPGCTEIINDLIIDGNSIDITDLTPLSQLTSIGGRLHVKYTNVTNLNGLHNITSIGTDLYFSNNSQLTNLSGLDNLTTIDGNLIVYGEYITNLDGIENLSSLGGLRLEFSPNLTNLSALSNINSLDGQLRITNSPVLQNLTGLENITSVGDRLFIARNDMMTNFTGLDGLTSIGDNANIEDNIALTDFTGLNQLTTVTGDLTIFNNDALTDLTALANLSTLEGELEIYNNSVISDLAGLENVDYTGITNLFIRVNPALSVCHVESICNYLQSGGTATLNNNATGCNSDIEVENACDPTSIICPQNITLITQQEVDNFPIEFPNCTSISGDLIIGSNTNPTFIVDLSPLSNLTSIGGDFRIVFNDNLMSLEGLNNLNSIGNFVILRNNNLTNFEGLENLNYIGGQLKIEYNENLTSLSGIENIHPDSLGYLKISNNENLTECSISSVCQYLEDGGTNQITFNATGCNNDTEVEAICDGASNLCPIGDLTLSTQQDVNDFLINYPNCTALNGSLTISSYPANPPIVDLNPLSNLTSIGGYLYVRSSNSLLSLEGLNNLTSISDYFEIYDNSSLTNFEGLNNLTSIGDYFKIHFNNIVDFTGLENLTSIGRYLNVFYSNVQTFDGLENLTEIDGNLNIYGNPSLTDINGLTNIDPATIKYLKIRNNPNLSICNLPNICTYLTDYGSQYDEFYGNALGCDTVSEILNSCSPNLCPDNLTLSTQQEVDDFPINYPNCTEMTGNLIIQNDITDLTPLSQLTSIGGDFRIRYSDLTSLNGLNNITSIGGTLGLNNNSQITNLNGLDNLTAIGNYLSLSNNNINSLDGINNLTSLGALNIDLSDEIDLSPLSNITSLEGDLRIFHTNLTSLSGLENITSVGGELSITNTDITNLTGLDGLTEVGVNVIIKGNALLTDFSGLNALTTIGDFLGIVNNDKLTDVTALANLTNLNLLQIFNNNILADLAGLDNIDHTGITEIDFRGNNQLSICGVQSICNYLQNGGIHTLANNASGCNTQAQIVDSCTVTPPDNPPCGGTSSTDSLTHIFDEDLFIDGVGFANNPVVTFTDPATPADAVLSDISLELYFRLNGNSCENEIALQITDPAGNTQALTAFTTCDGGNGLYYVNLNIPSANTTGSIADWTVEFDDTNDQNAGYEYSVRFARLNYVATSGAGGETILNEVTEIADTDLFIDGVGFENNGTYTFADPATPADAVLSDISLELYFRLNGASCENEIAIQITDPAGNTQALTAYTTCDGGNGLYYVNLDVPSGNTTGSPANWVVEFDDTNDQNSGYEYSVRFGRLTYTTTYTSGGGGMLVTVNEEITDFADSDLFIDGVGFANNGTYTFTDPATPADAVLSNISLELYFRLNGNSCENEIALQITDPAGNTQALTAYTTCDGGNGLYYINLNVPNGNTTGNVADWLVEFDDTNDQNSGYEYSVRFGRLTYDAEYTECVPMLINEENTSAHQRINTSAHELPDVTIFPNPTKGAFQIKGISQGKYIIHDATGRIIQSGEMKNDLSIDISQEVQGIYFMSIQIENETITKRIVKM